MKSRPLFEWHQEESHGLAWEWIEVNEMGMTTSGGEYMPLLTSPIAPFWYPELFAALDAFSQGVIITQKYQRISREVSDH